MAGWPYHTESSFVRDPGRYAHDAFGHVGADDKAVRPNDVCFRRIPHTGIDVSPKQKGNTNAPVVSPIYGEIVATGVDPEAGLWHIIKHDRYPEWWLGGHHSAFAKRSGRVERGEHIANMGMSGGALGVHVHWTVATSLAAALDQVRGYVNLRNGRTIASWAASEGLVDPWPLIEREWADEIRRRDEAARAAAAAAAAAAEAARLAEQRRIEEELMGAVDEIKAYIDQAITRATRPEIRFDAGPTGQEYDVLTSPRAALVHNATGFIFPLLPPDRSGQLRSIEFSGYSHLPPNPVAKGLPTQQFLNELKDILVATGRAPATATRDVAEALFTKR